MVLQYIAEFNHILSYLLHNIFLKLNKVMAES